MTNFPLCLVQKTGLMHKSKSKRNVNYIPIATLLHCYELTKLIKMSPNRHAKFYSIQVEKKSSDSNEDDKFVNGLKKPHHKIVLSYVMDHLC